VRGEQHRQTILPLYAFALYLRFKELRGKKLTPEQKKVSETIFDNINFNVVLNFLMTNAAVYSASAVGEALLCTARNDDNQCRRRTPRYDPSTLSTLCTLSYRSFNRPSDFRHYITNPNCQHLAPPCSECMAMFMEVFGEKFSDGEIGQQIMDKIQMMTSESLRENDLITKSTFIKIVNNHLGVLQPAFKMQAAIRSCIMGHRFWDAIEKRRTQEAEEEGSWKKSTGAKMVNKIDTREMMRRYKNEVSDGKLLAAVLSVGCCLVGLVGFR